MADKLKLIDLLRLSNQNKQTKENLSNLQTRLDLGLNNTPYYEKMDYKGYRYYPSQGKDDVPLTTNYYEYKGAPYRVYYNDFSNGRHYIYEQGDINGIDVNIRNMYDKNGIKEYSDTLYNKIPVNTPIGRDLQKRVESYYIGGNMTPNFLKGGAVKNNKPYYSWDVRGERGALGLPGNTSIYNLYPTGNYNTAFVQNRDGGYELVEVGKAAGIKSEIYNKYDKDGILQHSDSTFNGYSNKTPEGKAFQKRFENNIYDMTYKKYQQGGELGSNLGQLAKAAFQMANELKKQGAITEVAGEQVIAQAFQQTPEAAKMFVEAAQKQDVQTIVLLFTKLGIVK